MEKLLKLLEVKSIVTLVFTAVFSYLAVEHYITAVQVITIYTTIIGFYFGTQYEKKDN